MKRKQTDELILRKKVRAIIANNYFNMFRKLANMRVVIILIIILIYSSPPPPFIIFLVIVLIYSSPPRPAQ